MPAGVRLAGRLLFLLACAAAAWGAVQLLIILPWILRGSMDPDIPLYFVMGRGMLNGLTMYADLFEWKPPGMFLLTALSLLITGDQRFIGALTVLILLVIAVLPFLFAWRTMRGGRWSQTQWMIAALSLCLGLLLALYLEHWATGMDTETFGALLGSLYALSLFWRPRRRFAGLTVRSLLLLGAIGLKEYYLFILCAVALLLTEDVKDFARRFLLPLLVAALMGTILLLLFGLLQPYLSIYLPAMLAQRLAKDPLTPLSILALDPFPLVVHFLKQFRESRLFGVLLGLLLVLLPVLRAQESEDRRLPRLALSLLTGAAAGFFLYHLVPALMTLNSVIRTGTVYEFTRALSWGALIPSGIAVLVLIALHWRNRTFSSVLRALLALYLVSYAIAGAGYGGNHFAAAVPVYCALVLLAIRWARTEERYWVPWGLTLVAVIALLPYRTDADHWETLRNNAGRARQMHAEATDRVDALLDACGFERYALLEHPLDLAFTRHSPWGPIVTFELNWYLDPSHPIMLRTDENLRERNMVLLTGQTIPARTDAFVRSHFTETPPACAQPFLPIGTYRIWFRS